MEYIKNYNKYSNIENKIFQIEDFNYFISIDYELWFYEAIYDEIKFQLKWKNVKIKINFEKLEQLYPREIKVDLKEIYENMYIPQRNENFIVKQLKILNKFNF